MKYIYVGIDPGIVDTACVVLTMDHTRRTWKVEHKVWNNVTQKEGQALHVKETFLSELKEYLDKYPGAIRFVEGFRPRGRNPLQDQKMTMLVQTIRRRIHGEVIDNTGIKKIVTEPMLELFNMKRFPGTNHADIKSAARVALAGAIKNKEHNILIADFIRDYVEGHPWSQDS